MAATLGQVKVGLGKSRLMNQDISITGQLDSRLAKNRIAAINQLAAWTSRPDQAGSVNLPTIRQSHRFTVFQLFIERAGLNPKLGRRFRVKASRLGLLDQGVAKIANPVFERSANHAKLLIFIDYPRLYSLHRN